MITFADYENKIIITTLSRKHLAGTSDFCRFGSDRRRHGLVTYPDRMQKVAHFLLIFFAMFLRLSKTLAQIKYGSLAIMLSRVASRQSAALLRNGVKTPLGT